MSKKAEEECPIKAEVIQKGRAKDPPHVAPFDHVSVRVIKATTGDGRLIEEDQKYSFEVCNKDSCSINGLRDGLQLLRLGDRAKLYCPRGWGYPPSMVPQPTEEEQPKKDADDDNHEEEEKAEEFVTGNNGEDINLDESDDENAEDDPEAWKKHPDTHIIELHVSELEKVSSSGCCVVL